MTNVGCVVMASGLSARFSGEKLLTPFLGVPLIVHALNALPDDLARAVVVTRSENVHAVARIIKVDAILHELPQRADTIRLGLERIGHDIDQCFFLVGDQPRFTQQIMVDMMAMTEKYPDHIIRPRHGDRWGNPVLFPRSTFDELMHLQPGETGSAVIKRHSDMVVPYEIEDPLTLFDIDTCEQLDWLESQTQKK